MTSLRAILSESQRIGLIGPGDLEVAIEQARGFARAIPARARRVLDAGSGGGLPALVVAEERPDLHLTLVDRRGRACDLLRRAAQAQGWADRITVVHADLSELGHDPAWRGTFDAATARGVAPPADVAELVLPLVRTGGVLVVSTSGDGSAWPDDGLARIGARIRERSAGLVVVEAGDCPDAYPRRRRQPDLFHVKHP